MQRIIRSAIDHDATPAAAVLSVGFADDPLMSAIWPQTDRRHAALSKYFTTSLRYTHLRNEGVQVACVDGEIVGVAVWDPPGCVWRQPTADFIRSLPAVVTTLRDRIPAAMTVREVLQGHQPQVPHWYLANLVTAPHQRGQGHADAMLAERLATADATAVPSYLVCTRAANISYYERHGFTVDSEFILPVSHKPTMWGMIRQPAQSPMP